MDKVRAFLRATWKQRFWVLTVIAPLVAAICWMSASGKLQAEFQANKTTIEGHFSAMQSIASEPIHGNDQVNQKEMEETLAISKSVRALWQELYENQREQVLFWPNLGEDFVSYIEKKKFQSTISSDMRRRYLDYIETQFDRLLGIVDAQKLDTTGGTSGLIGGAEGRMMAPTASGVPGMTRDYLVDWLDQGELQTNLSFGGREPTSLQIWVAQEDLWVYETLLGVIDRTNEARGATRGAENAAIRVITELQVGAKAALAMNQKGNVIAPAAAAGDGMEQMMTGPEMGMPMDPMMGGDGMSAGAAVDAMLLMQRYIGADGKPIADPATGMGIEYRRLPVRMVLTMDQRWIPKVLVECANAPLPIEVQRLRINPEQSGAGYTGTIGSSAGMGGVGGMMGGGMEGGRGVPSFMGSPSSFTGGGAAAAPLPPGIAADYATVEIQGLVYIFNEPSEEQLKVEGAEDAAAGEAPAEGEPAPVGEEVAAVATPAVG